ncbi:hypothetical protein [Magnetospira sp. QH-2]|uniref:hypothetical protein n=1 Tax=Magnetospira sp. (strain QH-2) TaxID=1288970 RepID=UPI0003E810D9|nr:hypothetical protein [Magnetospira sp. QH-2]CCQ72338.1 protein of unknown function [Magnetospira sp. QH-2]
MCFPCACRGGERSHDDVVAQRFVRRWTRVGWVYAIRTFELTSEGLYLRREGRSHLLAYGTVGEVEVSPDGCKVLFVTGGEWHRRWTLDRSDRHARMVEVCAHRDDIL